MHPDGGRGGSEQWLEAAGSRGWPRSVSWGLLTLTGCDVPNNEFWRFGWPNGVTKQAQDMRELWTGSVIAALIVGVLVWGLILWCVVRHRKRSDELPRQTAYNLPLEIVYTILPFLIIAALFFFTVVVQDKVKKRSANPDETVAVDAFKWNWQFTYPDGQGPGRSSRSARSAPAPRSRSWCCRPTGRSASSSTSADVIHSFWVPEFLFKLDVIPRQRERPQQRLRGHRPPGGHLRRPLRRAVRHLPLAHELRGPRRSPATTTTRYLAARETGMSTAQALDEIGQPGHATPRIRSTAGRTANGRRAVLRWLSAPARTARHDARGGTAVKVEVAHLPGVIAFFCVGRGRRLRHLGAQDAAIGTTGAGACSGGLLGIIGGVLLVRLPPHRRPPRGPQGRRDRRRRRRAGLLQPGQLLAVRHRRCPPPSMGLALAFVQRG